MHNAATRKRLGLRRAKCVRVAALFMADATWTAKPGSHLVYCAGGPDSPEENLTS